MSHQDKLYKFSEESSLNDFILNNFKPEDFITVFRSGTGNYHCSFGDDSLVLNTDVLMHKGTASDFLNSQNS